MTATDPEEIKAEDWAGEMGEKWLANLGLFEGMIAPIGEALIDAAKAKPGEAVLDIGCGGGATTIALARAVGPTGTATGLDISPALTAATLKRAAQAGAGNLSCITSDATTVKLQPGAYDLMFSRFGVMFFDDPVKAFRNLRGALKSDGRLLFGCWAPPMENQWILSVMEVLGKHIELPAPVPRAPGPFAFAEPGYVKEILSGAGFKDIEIDAWRGTQYLAGKGSTPKTAADFVVNALSVGELVRKQSPAIQATIRRDIEEAFAEFATPDGVAMQATAWFVKARPA